MHFNCLLKITRTICLYLLQVPIPDINWKNSKQRYIYNFTDIVKGIGGGNFGTYSASRNAKTGSIDVRHRCTQTF